MSEENKNVELNEEQVEDVEGGLLAEMGLAAAMVFGQVAPLAAEMNITPEVQETGEQASTIALTKDNVVLVNTLTADGTEQTQQVQVVANGIELKQGDEYTVKNNTATEAGTYTLTVEGKGMYSGTIDVDFTVQAAQEEAQPEEEVQPEEEAQPEEEVQQEQEATVLDINTCAIVVDDAIYNGSPQVPNVTLTDADGNVLTEGTDYEVNTQEARQQEVGTYPFTIIGHGNYEGSARTAYFVIKGEDQQVGVGSGVYANPEDPAEQLKDISSCKIVVDNATYNGSPQVPNVTLTDADGNVLTEGTDYEINTQEARQQEVGTYPFTIVGHGTYEGSSRTAYFVIQQQVGIGSGVYANPDNPAEQAKDISACTVEVAQATYNGSPQLPDVTVKDADGNVLTAGTDYELNTQEARQQNVGTYNFTVYGLGNYDGTSKAASFTIVQATLGDDNVQLSENLIYNKKEQTQKVTVTYNGMTLTEGTDYDVTNNKATDKGNYTLTVTGKGNFAGTVNKTFTIYSEKEVVKTGENTNIALYAGVAAVAAAGLGALAAFTKKRSKH